LEVHSFQNDDGHVEVDVDPLLETTSHEEDSGTNSEEFGIPLVIPLVIALSSSSLSL
jgi:hypothetical protein